MMPLVCFRLFFAVAFGVILSLDFVATNKYRSGFEANFCLIRGNGLYPDPGDCVSFYSCFDKKTFHFACPPGLRFDIELQVCTWKAKCAPSTAAALNGSLLVEDPAPGPPVPPREILPCQKPDEVRCADGVACILRSKVCDTVRDCSEGGTDEYGCPTAADPFASQPCRPETCLLPACFCSTDGTQIPNNLGLSQVPQVILLAFLGAVNTQNYELIRSLFVPTRVNPNQCPVRATFFASHEYSDYSQIEKLHKAGHEIALSTISRDRESSYWWTSVSSHKDWTSELQSQKEILSTFAHIPLADVRGGQAPSLQLGGNTQYAAMQDMGLEWDSSITVPSTARPVWPYKLAYSIPHKCHQNHCPTRPYNVWEIPINQLIDSQGFGCASLGSCHNDDLKTSEELLQWLMKKFYRHYHDNRAPLVLLIDHNWMHEHSDALARFIETLTTKPEQDTFFLTYHQLVQWIQTPTTVDLLAEFVPWACDEEAMAGGGSACEPTDCELPLAQGGSRRFRACMTTCPASFPWRENSAGKKVVDPVLKKYVDPTATQSPT